MRMLTVLNVLGQDQKSTLSLRGANGDDGVYNRFSEFDVAIFLQAIGQELEENTSL
jgi:hypothetical protein